MSLTDSPTVTAAEQPASLSAAASETEACVSARPSLAVANDRDLGSRVTEPEAALEN